MNKNYTSPPATTEVLSLAPELKRVNGQFEAM